MEIKIGMDRDFEYTIDDLKRKYGEQMEILNGVHDSQLDFSEFIDNFIDKNTVADASIDANANVKSKDICALMVEKVKPLDKMFAWNKIFYEVKKKYGLQTAKEWSELEYNGSFYMHDFSSASYKPYCWATDLTRLAKEGLFFIGDYNNEPPKHLTTFLDDVIEYVSYFSNRSSGALGLPNVLIYSFWFWKKDVENGYYMKSPDYYRDQCFQKLIYRLNQPFLRESIQCSFSNISIFDRPYLEALFGGVVYPDGTFVIDHIDELIEFQKSFMRVVSDIRSHSLFTMPVLTYSLLYQNNQFVDEDFARWCSDHNTKWNDSNFFTSDDVGTLSNCCFDGSQKILTKSSAGVTLMTFKELFDADYNTYKRNFTVFHNGSWVKGKIVRLPKRRMFKIITQNNKTILVTDNHLNPTLRGDIASSDLTTEDYLLFNSFPLNSFKEKNLGLTYEEGFLIGMYLGDGSSYKSTDHNGTIINLSLNEQKYEESKHILDKALIQIGEDKREIRLSTPYNNVYPVSIHSNKVYSFIKEWVTGDYCYNKTLNMNSLIQSLEFRKGILDGFYLTDGGNSNRIYTTSEVLVSNIEALITSLGLVSTINVSDRTNEPVVIRGQSYKRNYPLYCIRWYNGGNRRSEKNVFIKRNNSIYFKIKSIEEMKAEDDYVYCFEMDNKEEPYFTLPNGIITHNCRLLSNTKKLDAFINSIGGTALCIGSVKVNTMNLMRIAYESGKDENAFLDILRSRTLLCCKVLDRVRHIIQRNIQKGLLPNFIDGGVEMEKLYNTCGILGLYEVIEAFGYTTKDRFGNISYTDEGINFATKIFETINDVKDNFTTEYSINVESVPAERAAVILCQKDNLLYEKNDKFIYSNQWIPLSEKCTIQEKVRLSAILDKKCSGGAIAHINLEANFPNKDTAWDMLNYIASQGVIYFAFNTRINECKNHHGFVGTDVCPECGEGVMDTYQRIVGFLTPTRSYSKDRKKEFTTRQWFDFAQEHGEL